MVNSENEVPINDDIPVSQQTRHTGFKSTLLLHRVSETFRIRIETEQIRPERDFFSINYKFQLSKILNAFLFQPSTLIYSKMLLTRQKKKPRIRNGFYNAELSGSGPAVFFLGFYYDGLYREF